MDGRPVGIFSKSSNKFIDGRDAAGKNVLMTQAGSPNGNLALTWQVIHVGEDRVAVRNFLSGGFLNGKQGQGTDALVTYGDPHSDTGIQWKLIPTGEDEWFVLENYTSKGYLDGRSYEPNALVTNRPWKGDNFFYFKFVVSAL